MCNWQLLFIYSAAENVFVHTLKDTIKNLKHGSDSLASILCSYKDCHVETAKQIVVLTDHIIKDKLTILKYSPGNSCKWAVVETRSCTVPLTHERRKKAIKLFELFAYIYVSKIMTYIHTVYLLSWAYFSWHCKTKKRCMIPRKRKN